MVCGIDRGEPVDTLIQALTESRGILGPESVISAHIMRSTVYYPSICSMYYVVHTE